MPSVQFVNYGDTIADIAQTEKASASLTATTSILLSVLLLVSFVANLLLVATIISSYKLRNCILYLILCQVCILNAIDTILIMFVSLVYVANGTWIFGDLICKLNACAQEFISLYTFFLITLMAVERALGLTDNGRHLVSKKYALAFSFVFGTVALCFATPAFFPGFSVRPYPYRYLCAIGQSPIAYSIVQIIAYNGCIFVSTICFGALIRYNNVDRSLPARPQDYGAFIMESRALQDHMIQGRLVIFIFFAFIFIQGPYIILNLFVQIRNSAELLRGGNPELELVQDVDTLITWLRFFFPSLVAVLINTNCHDIWVKLVNLICCRRSNGVWTTQKGNNPQYDNRRHPTNDNVLTLVATTEGLQIRSNGNFIAQPTHHQYRTESEPAFQQPNQYEEEESSEIETEKTIHPQALKIPRGFATNRKRSKIPRTNRHPNQMDNKTFRVVKNPTRPKVSNTQIVY